MTDTTTYIAEDPCATLALLQKARLDILTGQRQVRVKIENFEVLYSDVQMAALEAAITRYSNLCARAQGKSPTRFAIRAGAMRPPLVTKDTP